MSPLHDLWRSKRTCKRHTEWTQLGFEPESANHYPPVQPGASQCTNVKGRSSRNCTLWQIKKKKTFGPNKNIFFSLFQNKSFLNQHEQMDRHKLLIFYFFIRSSVCFTDFCQHLSTASSFFFSFPIYDDRIGPTWGPPTTALGSSFWGFDQNPFLFTVEYNLIQLKKRAALKRFIPVCHTQLLRFDQNVFLWFVYSFL